MRNWDLKSSATKKYQDQSQRVNRMFSIVDSRAIIFISRSHSSHPWLNSTLFIYSQLKEFTLSNSNSTQSGHYKSCLFLPTLPRWCPRFISILLAFFFFWCVILTWSIAHICICINSCAMPMHYNYNYYSYNFWVRFLLAQSSHCIETDCVTIVRNPLVSSSLILLAEAWPRDRDAVPLPSLWCSVKDGDSSSSTPTLNWPSSGRISTRL